MLLEFLKTIFGNDINTEDFNFPKQTPFYIRDSYNAKYLIWNNNRCILLAPKASNWRLPTLKKQLMNFQEISSVPCALSLENLTSLQRKNLIESNIPFVSASQQVFLPFWGCFFLERFKAKPHIAEKMAPGTQAVFLYLYYMHDIGSVNLTNISKALNISKATCTRAITDLEVSELLKVDTFGTNKWISLLYEKPELLKKAFARLKSPVERHIFMRKPFFNCDYPKSGMLALSTFSMIGINNHDGAIALSKKSAANIPVENIMTQMEFKDFGGYIAEVWSYDPNLFANNGIVDDVSLLLSMENNPNERVQMCLDLIREKHQLPIRNDE